MRAAGLQVCFLAICLAVCRLYGQVKSEAVAVEAKISPTEVSQGEPIKLEVDYTNLSSRRIYLTLIQGFAAEYNAAIEVHSIDGKPAATTEYYDTVLNPANHPGKLVSRNTGLRSAEPGETLIFKVNLTELYLLPPGKYEIRVGKAGTQNASALVWSKPTTFDVVRK